MLKKNKQTINFQFKTKTNLLATAQEATFTCFSEIAS